MSIPANELTMPRTCKGKCFSLLSALGEIHPTSNPHLEFHKCWLESFRLTKTLSLLSFSSVVVVVWNRCRPPTEFFPSVKLYNGYVDENISPLSV